MASELLGFFTSRLGNMQNFLNGQIDHLAMQRNQLYPALLTEFVGTFFLVFSVGSTGGQPAAVGMYFGYDTLWVYLSVCPHFGLKIC